MMVEGKNGCSGNRSCPGSKHVPKSLEYVSVVETSAINMQNSPVPNFTPLQQQCRLPHTPDRRTSSGGFGTSFAPSLPVTPVPPSNRLSRDILDTKVSVPIAFPPCTLDVLLEQKEIKSHNQ